MRRSCVAKKNPFQPWSKYKKWRKCIEEFQLIYCLWAGCRLGVRWGPLGYRWEWVLQATPSAWAKKPVEGWECSWGFPLCEVTWGEERGARHPLAAGLPREMGHLNVQSHPQPLQSLLQVSCCQLYWPGLPYVSAGLELRRRMAKYE